MKNTFKLLALFLSVILISTSCEKDEDVAPANLEGTWVIQSESIDIQGTDDDFTGSNDYSSKNYKLVLKSDGKFTSDAYIGLDGVYEDESISGTYTVSGSTLILAFNDEGIDSKFYLNTALSGNNLTLEANKENIVKSIDNSSFDAGQKLVLKAYIGAAKKYNVTIKLKKA